MMKNPLVIIGIIVILGIFGFGAFSLSQQSSSQKAVEPNAMMKKDESVMQKEEAMMEKSDDKMMAESAYVTYSKTAFDTAATKRRVLFFYASWCPTCRPADENLKTNVSQIPSDVTVIRVNYNDPETDQEERDLAKKYGVTYQHTYVQIDETGKEVTKWNGGQITELLANIK